MTSSLTWTSSRDGPIGGGGSFAKSNLSAGIHTITATARDPGGQTGSKAFAIQIVSGYHVLVSDGDISECTTDHDAETAAVLDQTFGTVITLGDNAYPNGTPPRSRPATHPPGAGTRRGRGPHSGITSSRPPTGPATSATSAPPRAPPQRLVQLDVAAWHVVVLNAECSQVPVGCSRTSPQGQWLAADLAAHPNLCTLAIMHHPRFGSSGTGDEPGLLDFWQLLYEAGVDVALSGHQHDYERFAPQSPTGQADASRGIREFIVGTGGAGLQHPGPPHANSVVQNGSTYGVLKLTLYSSSYNWQFLPVAGGSFTDGGQRVVRGTRAL